MKAKNQVVPDEVLSKEFLSQFKTEDRSRCKQVFEAVACPSTGKNARG